MRPLPVPDDRVEKRSAGAASVIAGVGIAPDEHRYVFSRYAQLLAFDAAHRLVRGAGGSTAFRAVAVHCVHKRIFDLVLGRATCTAPSQCLHRRILKHDRRRRPQTATVARGSTTSNVVPSPGALWATRMLPPACAGALRHLLDMPSAVR